jgi:hypothetical protein
MSDDVIFEEDSLTSPVRKAQQKVHKPSFLVTLVLKTGIAKTYEETQKVLLGVAVLCFVLAIISLFTSHIV